MAYVYKHIRLDTNDVFYIGISEFDAYRPYNKQKRNQFWKNIVAISDYKVEITHQDICIEEAKAIERYLISFYGRKNLRQGTLCNLTDGGEGCSGLVVSEKTREKFRGKNNYMYGKTHSKEMREKISKIIKERMTDEIKKHISDMAKGRITKPETKQKLIITSPKRKIIYQIINGKLITYDSIRQASKVNKFNRDNFKYNPERYPYLLTFEQLPNIYKKMITEESPL
jgi:group I intron endonuclease